MGETRVDLLHLLEDLRDAYPGATEETILSEIIANSLDSGATTIALTTDPTLPALTVTDDGSGMRRRELARYHDIAASSKIRGDRIGFAGVGIKIGLLVSEEVVTETRSGKHHVATTWRLASRHKAPWRWVPPPGLVSDRGTAVRLRLSSPLSALLDPGFIEAAVRRQFQPLLDPAFDDILRDRYRRGVVFVVNGRRLERQAPQAQESAPVAIRMGRRRKPAAAGYLIRESAALAEDRRGVAISTFGKVIKRGWDWLGVTPATPDRVGGLIEAPGLAECLTLNKADFIRGGARGATYLAYRKALQEAVTRQLAVWGDAPRDDERARRRVARPVERDLEAVLMDLADRFPLLSALVERRAGGQRTLPFGGPGARPQEEAAAVPLLVAPPAATHGADGVSASGPAPTAERPETPDSPEPTGDPGPPATGVVAEPATGARAARRPARYGLSIQFEQRPDDSELSRLVESTVWINEAHPAYRRAVASRSEGYHIALAAAMALAPLAVEPPREHAFITEFLASWGEALDRRPRRR